MKRLFALLLALCLMAAVFAGCKKVESGTDEPAQGQETPDPTPTPDPDPTPLPEPEPVTPGTTDETTANVNLRKAAGTDAAILTVIPKGSTVNVLATEGKWCQVEYDGGTGYVATGYLKTLGAGVAKPDSGNASQQPTSAAQGNPTGVQSLDAKVKAIIDDVADPADSKLEQMKAVYRWVAENFRYKAIAVDLSNGYTDALINQLAEEYLDSRKGSCEHYAAIVYVLFRRLDASFAPIMVTGDRWDIKNSVWGEHAWVIMAVDGVYYHFDGLYGRNHLGDTMKGFMKTDTDFESNHRWDHDAYPVCG